MLQWRTKFVAVAVVLAALAAFLGRLDPDQFTWI